MSVNDITLSGGMRAALVNLQLSAMLQARTTERLATGLRVNSPIDDAAAYFAAQDHRSQANDLAALKDAMGEAIQTVKAADDGVKAITSLIQQAKGLVASARSATTTDRATLATQFNALLTQIDQLAGDAGYKGTNLLAASSTLSVTFNTAGSSTLTITGFDASTTGLSVAGAANAWAADADIQVASDALDAALKTLRTNAASLSSNNGIISSRQDFTSSLIQTLSDGADGLTMADTNEESANMVTLQTRQQISIGAMSLSNQASQAILKLF
ncbi:MAG: flagellin [Candidatus Eiseniibacteriota bacterium]